MVRKDGYDIWEMFEKVKTVLTEADASDISEHLAYQFHITGEAEGFLRGSKR